MASQTMSSIRKFYEGKTILITGGTGFMGKVLVEKLLRSCPELKQIILLIRPKKDLTSTQRMQGYFKDEVFYRINNNCILTSKVQGFNGDIKKPKLGLSQDDIQFLNNNVNLFFHSAADVNFGQNLHAAVKNILVGANSVLELSKQMKSLQALMHVSTIGVINYKDPVLEEKVVSRKIEPETLLGMLDCGAGELLNDLEEKFVKDELSVYSFVKNATENLMRKNHGSVPTAIFRPGIVGPVYKEPIPGWNNNFYGYTGLQMSYATGLLRILSANLNSPSFVVPCDITVNALIASTCEIATAKSKNIKVYNCLFNEDSTLTRGKCIDYIRKYNHMYPLEKMLLYPKVRIVHSSKNTIKILLFIYHTIPAYIMDAFIKKFGGKPTFVKKYQMINDFVISTHPFFNHNALIPSENLKIFWKSMSSIDREVFQFDLKKVNWKEYMESLVKGTKVYVLRENMDNMNKARAHSNRLMIQHYLWQLFLISTSVGGITIYFLPS